MRLAADRAHVTVPATSANLGPGFDALGIALAVRDEITVHAVAGAVNVTITGHGAGAVPTDASHLVARATLRALEHVGAPLTGLELHCHNRIPHGRGLGSSAAAVVAGIMAARGLISEPEALNDAVVLQLATEMEGHPDNAAPALLGGFTIAWIRDGATPRAVKVPVAAGVVPALLVPAQQCATSAARGALPAQIAHADGAFNAGRAALLTHALSADPDLLFEATEDRLHQNYRAEVMPQTADLLSRLRSEGVAAVISGAGPSVLVLHAPAGVDVGAIAGAKWQYAPVQIDESGATVSR
ncbi:MAG TPA: homoserine kinase [Actinomycetales bacterium]|nr:homoserine kinase [Actinomycetales bacterium]